MPENSVATLDLRAEAPASRDEEDTDRSPHLSIELQLTREGSHFDVKVPEMPDLGEGDSLEFSFSFSTREELSRIWAVLSVENLRSDKNSLLHIPRFAVSVDQGAQLDEPRVNTLRVEEIEK